MKIEAILATKGMNVITTTPTKQVREVVAVLKKNNIGALVVVDDAGRTVGILSERDVIRSAAENENVFSLLVRDIMTAEVITGTPDDDLDAVLRTMISKHFRHLPVLEQGKLVGIVTVGDVVTARLNYFRGEVDKLHQRHM